MLEWSGMIHQYLNYSDFGIIKGLRNRWLFPLFLEWQNSDVIPYWKRSDKEIKQNRSTNTSLWLLLLRNDKRSSDKSLTLDFHFIPTSEFRKVYETILRSLSAGTPSLKSEFQTREIQVFCFQGSSPWNAQCKCLVAF